MKFYKELSKAGATFFWLFLVVFFWQQMFVQWQVFAYNSDFAFSRTSEIIYLCLNYALAIASLTHAWLSYHSLADRKKAILNTFLYAGLFYLVLVISSALYPGLISFENAKVRPDFFFAAVLLFYCSILDPLFKRAFKNIYVKMIAQVVSIQLINKVLALIFLTVATSFIAIDSVSYKDAMTNIFSFYWPNAILALGVVLMHFCGPLAACALCVVSFVIYVVMIIFQLTWDSFEFNRIIAWTVVAFVFFKVHLKSKLPPMTAGA